MYFVHYPCLETSDRTTGSILQFDHAVGSQFDAGWEGCHQRAAQGGDVVTGHPAADIDDFRAEQRGVEDLFEPLTERPVESVFDELGIDPDQPISGQTPNPKPDRKALDDFIFDVVGLSEEQRTQVYLSLCEMVQNRLYKAKNIL